MPKLSVAGRAWLGIRWPDVARRCTKTEWDCIVEAVVRAAAFPRDFHVEIVRVRNLGAHGTADGVDLETGRFRIEIDMDMTAAHTADILIHEVAHVLDWRPLTPFTRDHGPTFWIYFGEVWCRYRGVT